MPRIYFVRHAENNMLQNKILAGRIPGIHLNNEGKENAMYLAERFRNKPIKAIYSSPLERTIETAQPIAEVLSIEVITTEGLLEIDFGSWQNTPFDILHTNPLWEKMRKMPSLVRFPDGESYVGAQFRVCQFIEELVLKYETNDSIICVTHGDVIRLALSFYAGFPLDMIKRLSVSPASISVLSINPSGSRLLGVNIPIDKNSL